MKYFLNSKRAQWQYICEEEKLNMQNPGLLLMYNYFYKLIVRNILKRAKQAKTVMVPTILQTWRIKFVEAVGYLHDLINSFNPGLPLMKKNYVAQIF